MKTKEYPKINYQIRPVKQADLDRLFDMLIDLVKHERSDDRFQMTRDRLEQELFGDNADWHCLIAADSQEKAIGFCLYTFANINRAFNTSPMIQVDDLYIDPLYRRTGIARHLFYQLALIAKEKKIGRLNIWCVKENELGQGFYQKIGAEKRGFIDIYSIQVNQLLPVD